MQASKQLGKPGSWCLSWADLTLKTFLTNTLDGLLKDMQTVMNLPDLQSLSPGVY